MDRHEWDIEELLELVEIAEEVAMSELGVEEAKEVECYREGALL